MRDPLPLLIETDFPPVRRARLETLQVNVGYLCNQSCLHCHVAAGPKRTEQMTRETAEQVVRLMDASGVSTLDLTGGAPEMNANFRYLVEAACERGIEVIDRCNLTILEQPGFDDLTGYLAAHRVRVVASLPCYLEDNVDRQRGLGVFAASVRGLRRLNGHGYGRGGTGLTLDLVYNPQGPSLPPPQVELESAYREMLADQHEVVFDRLLTLANMPVGRFGSTLISRGEFDGYMDLLRGAYSPTNLDGLMCRSLLSIDWQGYAYDCDFNQMLDLPMRVNGTPRVHIGELLDVDVEGSPIVVRDHCYGCAAGQGSSCGGALA